MAPPKNCNASSTSAATSEPPAAAPGTTPPEANCQTGTQFIVATEASPCPACRSTSGCQLAADWSELRCATHISTARPTFTDPTTGKTFSVYDREATATYCKSQEKQRLNPQPAKLDEMVAWMRLLLEPGQVTELRAIGVSNPSYRQPHTESGFYDYDHIEDMMKEARRLTMQAKGAYFVINPLNPDIIHRRCNRVEVVGKGDGVATDDDVIRRRLLLVDTDAAQKYVISRTDAEKAATRQIILDIRDAMREDGWPEPIFADSGNGHHLFYRIDLPADDGELVKRVLHGLSCRFSTEAVNVDTTVFNLSRICKIPGTIARKGDSTPTRPHRASRILEVPS
jgi:hypothetical protein